jgi:hypothetical protein
MQGIRDVGARVVTPKPQNALRFRWLTLIEFNNLTTLDLNNKHILVNKGSGQSSKLDLP